MATAFFSHPKFLEHDNGAHHPESAARLQSIEAALRRDGLWQRILHPHFEAASSEQLEYCHEPQLIEEIRNMAAVGGGQIDGDTRVSAASYDAASLAVGAALCAVDGVLAGRWQNAFVASRPPGHHATRSRAMGFCLFNTIAIAARHARRAHGLKRVAVVDFDVHHGNGTQDIFYEDGSVFFASVHQWPLYPGTGRPNERGSGAGEGATLNIPLEGGHGNAEYLQVWNEVGKAVKAFRPELILVSAGFDAHRDDPLGGMKLTPEGFAALTRSTLDWSCELCESRVVCVLEGGYSLNGLAESVAMVVETLLDVGTNSKGQQ
jgi:acetoin utilization deacetylase AcuC-like enzyme